MTENNSKSNFDKVINFNRSFGVPVFTEEQKEIFDKNPELVKLRLSLIQEEVKELEQAINEKDFTEVIDALSDILYVVYGAGASFGINLNKMFDIVHESNMSKLCKTEEEAKETVQNYERLRNEGKSPYDSPDYRRADDGVNWVVFNKSTGKILKSINYTPAKFD